MSVRLCVHLHVQLCIFIYICESLGECLKYLHTHILLLSLLFHLYMPSDVNKKIIVSKYVNMINKQISHCHFVSSEDYLLNQNNQVTFLNTSRTPPPPPPPPPPPCSFNFYQWKNLKEQLYLRLIV